MPADARETALSGTRDALFVLRRVAADPASNASKLG
jgi:hypothetical protein